MGRIAPSTILARKHEGVDTLHNKSTVTIFCTPDKVEDIQNVKNKLLDFVTNAGIFQTTQKATIPG